MATKRGSALISALFIMALIAIVATAMTTRLQLDIYRTRLIETSDKLYLASQFVTFWAMDQLAVPNRHFVARDNTGKILEFPHTLQTIYPNFKLSGQVWDLQARFNLNNLQQEQYKLLYFGLLENTLPETPANQRRLLLNATINWLGPYRADRGHDPFIQYYTGHKPPYWPSYQPMRNVSELRLVQGVTPTIYRHLEPYITALPDTTPINLNTAPKAMLKSLGNGLNDAQVALLLKARGQTGFHDMNDVRELLQKLYIPAEQLTVDSAYFLCEATVNNGERNFTIWSILKRKIDGETMVVNIINENSVQ